jgi:hypothetical protein
MAKKRTTKPVKSIPIKESQRAEYAMQQIRNLAAEFFEAGVILMTKETEGKTEFLHTNFGNQFSIKGMINTYVNEYINEQLQDVEMEFEGDDE